MSLQELETFGRVLIAIGILCLIAAVPVGVYLIKLNKKLRDLQGK